MEVQTAGIEGYIYYSGTTIPVSGVTVQIGNIPYTTDASGYYILDKVEIGTKTLTATKLNYDSYSRNINVLEGGILYNIEMTSDIYTNNVYGNVKDDEGNPLSNVTVTLLNPDESESSLITTTDATGYYQLPSVPQGARIISIKYFNNLYGSIKTTLFISNSDYPYNAILEKHFGEFIDYRDTTTYNWVKIGMQIWMAENLKFDCETNHCYAYDNNESYIEQFGRLYRWGAAMNYSNYSSLSPSGVKGICPDGWHVPSRAEWKQLTQFISNQKGLECNFVNYLYCDEAGKYLKATSSWIDNNGIDEYGFRALAGGYRDQWQKFMRIGEWGVWWSTDLNTSLSFDHGEAAAMYSSHNSFSFGRAWAESAAASVRCVKN